MKLYINEIIVDERIRKGTGANIKELADDIKKNGQIQPITVRVDDSGAYRLVTGFRRMMAMKAIGAEKIEAYVISEADEEKLLQMEISENEVRESFTRTERMNYIKRLEEIERAKAKERQQATQFGSDTVKENSPAPKGQTRDAVAEQVGVSSNTIAREKQIIEHKTEIDPEDFKNWDEHKLSTNKVFKELQRKLKRLEENPIVVEKKPDDYDSLKSQIADYKQSDKVLRADKEKLLAERDKWERLYKESGRIEPELDEQAAKDMEYLARGIHTFLTTYGAKAWSIDRRASIPAHRTDELKTQAENLYAFAQNLYEMTKGE